MFRNCILRTAVILLFLNSIAYAVNLLSVTPRIVAEKDDRRYELFLLTDAAAARTAAGFWPFVNFYQEYDSREQSCSGRFIGIFANFGGLEFLLYASLIAAVVLFLRFW